MTADALEPVGADPWAAVSRLDAYAERGDRVAFGTELAELSLLVGDDPQWRWRLALIRAAQCAFEGRYELARSLLEQAPDAGVHDPSGSVTEVFHAFLARQTGSGPGGPSAQPIIGSVVTACAEADPDAARTLYELLEPYAGSFASVSAHTPSEGPVSLYLGMLATVLADWPGAEAQLRAALAAARTAGSPPWEAFAHFELVQLRLARDGHVDDDHLSAAIGLAERLGMEPLAVEARRLQPPISALTPREQEVVVLVAEGLANEQIADRLGMDEQTAESHVTHILMKLRFDRRASIGAWHAQFASASSNRRNWSISPCGPPGLNDSARLKSDS